MLAGVLKALEQKATPKSSLHFLVPDCGHFFCFPRQVIKTLNVFLRLHLLMYFFSFCFPFRFWMNPSMATKQVSDVPLSVFPSVRPFVYSFICLNAVRIQLNWLHG